MQPSFRSSTFMDFNAGTVKLAPMILMGQSPQPWDRSKKIEIFEARVEVWQLGVAAEMLKSIEAADDPSIWSHSAYGLIAVVFSYFEMIGKTLNPNSASRNTANVDFLWGFSDVYPKHKPTSGTYSDTNLPEVKQYRDRIRNGIYHLAFTKESVLAHNDHGRTEDFEVETLTDPNDPAKTETVYRMNPHRITRTIIDHFPSLIARLRDPDPQHDKLREKFEEFFDDYHAVP